MEVILRGRVFRALRRWGMAQILTGLLIFFVRLLIVINRLQVCLICRFSHALTRGRDATKNWRPPNSPVCRDRWCASWWVLKMVLRLCSCVMLREAGEGWCRGTCGVEICDPLPLELLWNLWRGEGRKKPCTTEWLLLLEM